MATNGLLIEFGATGVLDEKAQKMMGSTIETLNGWKSDGTIEEYRFYPIVTGNRSERVVMIMLEMSHQQLEALVVKKAYMQFMEGIMSNGTNVTTNRAITLERLLELMKETR